MMVTRLGFCAGQAWQKKPSGQIANLHVSEGKKEKREVVLIYGLSSLATG